MKGKKKRTITLSLNPILKKNGIKKDLIFLVKKKKYLETFLKMPNNNYSAMALEKFNNSTQNDLDHITFLIQIISKVKLQNAIFMQFPLYLTKNQSQSVYLEVQKKIEYDSEFWLFESIEKHSNRNNFEFYYFIVLMENGEPQKIMKSFFESNYLFHEEQYAQIKAQNNIKKIRRQIYANISNNRSIRIQNLSSKQSISSVESCKILSCKTSQDLISKSEQLINSYCLLHKESKKVDLGFAMKVVKCIEARILHLNRSFTPYSKVALAVYYASDYSASEVASIYHIADESIRNLAHLLKISKKFPCFHEEKVFWLNINQISSLLEKEKVSYFFYPKKKQNRFI